MTKTRSKHHWVSVFDGGFCFFQSSSKPSSGKTIINSTTMDNISEPRTEVESIVAAPSHTVQTTTVITSVSQEPIFDGAHHERLRSHDDNEDDLNVSEKNPLNVLRLVD